MRVEQRRGYVLFHFLAEMDVLIVDLDVDSLDLEIVVPRLVQTCLWLLLYVN